MNGQGGMIGVGCALHCLTLVMLLLLGADWGPRLGVSRLAGLGMGFLAFLVVEAIWAASLPLIDLVRRGRRRVEH